jgi:ABC-type nickel/cobalt efflux system permease component RcnA
MTKSFIIFHMISLCKTPSSKLLISMFGAVHVQRWAQLCCCWRAINMRAERAVFALRKGETHTYTHIHTHIHTSALNHTHRYTHTHSHTHTPTHTHPHTHTHTCTRISTRTRIHTLTCAVLGTYPGCCMATASLSISGRGMNVSICAGK